MNRDNCLAPFIALKTELESRGWVCHTQDHYLSRGETPSDVLFLDVPKLPLKSVLGPWMSKVRAHLLIQECEVVLPRNWLESNHQSFISVFTWSPELIAMGGRYHETNFSQVLEPPGEGLPFVSRKLCTLIAGNKGSRHPLELYSKRVEAIRYFESTSPADFDLYGVGWDQVPRSNIFLKALNRFPPLSRFFASRFPSYRGKVVNKKRVLESYRFAICFENARDIPGYVTEKVFDCLMAGCVPIYWGAPDITDRIPQECFIDFRKFANYSELLAYLKSYDERMFRTFLESTRSFLASPAAHRYSASFFGKSIVDGITSP